MTKRKINIREITCYRIPWNRWTGKEKITDSKTNVMTWKVLQGAVLNPTLFIFYY